MAAMSVGQMVELFVKPVGADGHLDRLVFSFQKQVERVSGLVPLLRKIGS